MTRVSPPSPEESAFSHQALLYAGQDEFLAGTLRFIGDGLDRDQPILVVVGGSKIGLLREALDGAADRVRFADMTQVGRNPTRIISLWRDFVAAHPDRTVRGIGEPIWAGRSPAELVECQRHEALLNLAFVDSPGWSLLCPYDVDSLDPEVVHQSCRHHPVLRGEAHRRGPGYPGSDTLLAELDQPLPAPPAEHDGLAFTLDDLALVRRTVAGHAEGAGLPAGRAAELVLAVDELACNSVGHAGDSGVLRVWQEHGELVCEVSDRGHIADPLAGRQRPAADQPRGRGLWLVNELCDLVRLRSAETGTTVRLHMACRERAGAVPAG
jgi:anti-sigma regulatory factor (Ser/Thr protein kinase)